MLKFSIVMPVYNSAKVLEQSLDSVIAQTLSEFEIICVNDGSKDNSLEILQKYAQKDSRFVIIDKNNEGPGIARNIAIEKAQGEYLLCLDSDDWLEKNALELIYNKIKEDDADILFYDVYKYIEREQKKYLFKNTEIYKNFKNKPFTPKECGEALLQTNSLPFKSYRMKFIKENNIKYTNHKFMEDAPFYIKSMICANKITCLSKPLYNYRVSAKSSSYQYKQYLKSMPEIYDICFELIENVDDKKILKSFIQNRKKSLYYFYHFVSFFNKHKYFRMMKDIIKNNFSKYELDDDMKEVLNSNAYMYIFNRNIKKTKTLLNTYRL